MIFAPTQEGGYTVTVPPLPGLMTEGDTLEEANEMARDAIRCYLEGHFMAFYAKQGLAQGVFKAS